MHCTAKSRKSKLLYNTEVVCICLQWACAQWASWTVGALGQIVLGRCTGSAALHRRRWAAGGVGCQECKREL